MMKKRISRKAMIISFAKQVSPINFHYFMKKNLDGNQMPTRGCWTTVSPGPKGVIKVDFEIKFC